MSHIATKVSTEIPPKCHYSGRAFSVAAFYTCPMALRIRELRIEKGWTQSELAEKSGMSRSQLAMIENETRPANTLRLNAIAKALDVTTEMLFSGTEQSDLVAIISSLDENDRETLVRLAESLAAKRSRE